LTPSFRQTDLLDFQNKYSAFILSERNSLRRAVAAPVRHAQAGNHQFHREIQRGVQHCRTKRLEAKGFAVRILILFQVENGVLKNGQSVFDWNSSSPHLCGDFNIKL